MCLVITLGTLFALVTTLYFKRFGTPSHWDHTTKKIWYHRNPYHVGKLSVTVPFREASVNGFIDDLITILIDNKACLDRAHNMAITVIHGIFLPKLT